MYSNGTNMCAIFEVSPPIRLAYRIGIAHDNVEIARRSEDIRRNRGTNLRPAYDFGRYFVSVHQHLAARDKTKSGNRDLRVFSTFFGVVVFALASFEPSFFSS